MYPILPHAKWVIFSRERAKLDKVFLQFSDRRISPCWKAVCKINYRDLTTFLWQQWHWFPSSKPDLPTFDVPPYIRRSKSNLSTKTCSAEVKRTRTFRSKLVRVHCKKSFLLFSHLTLFAQNCNKCTHQICSQFISFKLKFS